MSEKEKLTRQIRLLRIVSVLFIIGGVIRLFANRALFEIFLMGDLWVEHGYFIYIYRVLGSFVIFTGLILFAVSKNIEKYSGLLFILTLGFVLIGLVMIVSGVSSKLPLVFFGPDFVFCFIVAWFVATFRTRQN